MRCRASSPGAVPVGADRAGARAGEEFGGEVVLGPAEGGGDRGEGPVLYPSAGAVLELSQGGHRYPGALGEFLLTDPQLGHPLVEGTRDAAPVLAVDLAAGGVYARSGLAADGLPAAVGRSDMAASYSGRTPVPLSRIGISIPAWQGYFRCASAGMRKVDDRISTLLTTNG